MHLYAFLKEVSKVVLGSSLKSKKKIISLEKSS